MLAARLVRALALARGLLSPPRPERLACLSIAARLATPMRVLVPGFMLARVIVVPVGSMTTLTATVLAGTLTAGRSFSVFASARLTTISGGSAFSCATTSTATSAPSTTSTTALLAIPALATLSGRPMSLALTAAVLALGASITRARGYCCVETISDVFIAVGFTTGPTAGLHAIPIGPIGVTAVAIPVAAASVAAMTLAFRATLIVATLR